MLNYYRVTFSTGEHWELYSWKLLCRHYHMITSALIDNDEYLMTGEHNTAKVYYRNTCVASFELYNWGDGTGDIYSDGQFVRHVSNLRVKEV